MKERQDPGEVLVQALQAAALDVLQQGHMKPHLVRENSPKNANLSTTTATASTTTSTPAPAPATATAATATTAATASTTPPPPPAPPPPPPSPTPTTTAATTTTLIPGAPKLHKTPKESLCLEALPSGNPTCSGPRKAFIPLVATQKSRENACMRAQCI